MFSDFADVFMNATVSGIPLVLIPLGLVAWLKSLGLKDKKLTISSMIVGLLFGCPYMYIKTADQFVTGMPPGVLVGGIFSIIVFGIGLGLIASGIYKVGEGLALKAKS